MRPIIRLATDADGPAIGQLFVATGLADLGVDWTAGLDGWLVAEEDGEVLGAIQVATGKPFGFIGDIVVAPKAQARNGDGRGRLSKCPGAVGVTLWVVALDLLKRAGAQRALGITDKPGLKKLLTRHGGQALGDHMLFSRDLTDWKGITG